MRRHIPTAVFIMAALGAIPTPSSHAAEVTFESLVREMTDLDALASFPDPAYDCAQFSSYDRRSTDPSVLTDENWFANGDRGHHIRKETRNGADEWVMVDTDGPGAIVRIWSANANDAGIVRIYLDNAPDPVIEMPLEEMLDGKHAPFLAPISGIRSRGWNTHFPIPYAKHCKITAGKPNFYYHVNYRTYKEGAQVESYRPEMAETYAELLTNTLERLANPSESTITGPQSITDCHQTIAPGANTELRIEGEGAVHSITCKAEADDLELALRQCVFAIAFDDHKTPSVQAPLGDFFGTAPGINPYQSLPCGVLDDGTMYSHWVMPYRESVAIRVSNHGENPVAIHGVVTTGPREWTKRSLYFNAGWRAEYDIPTHPRQDWTYVQIDGKGRFVGDMLHVTNPVKNWWGEGDEKIYVDGEEFPSHFGTGSEDYYGYAWCNNRPFTHAYHNQPRCDGPGNYGHTCVSRFHILDNIPFKKDFKFDIEVWHSADTSVNMAATSYWYARPRAEDDLGDIAPDDLRIVTPPPLPEPKRVEGALEGEKLELLSVSGGNATTQESAGWPWSGAQQLWWIDGTPGDTLALAFDAPEAGRYDVRAVFTKAIDYGIMQLSINGQKAGEPMDFFNDGVIVTDEASIGAFEFEKGQNTLTVEILGANEKCKPKRYMFGLDYLLLKPAG
ncbi:MAG: DUF2961 domain-containing protein [Candidatus Hydrogenedentes bacterium]|nr:DUF2961 domain-containing protein [Candidatus Hydrogenedentota bacterium]